MTADVRKWQSRGLVSAIALVLLTATVMAAPGKSGEYNPNDATVEMFAAIEKGDIAVQLSFKDATQGRIRVENKTDKPLNVKLPDAFAGLPVLAQRGIGGGGGAGRAGGGGGRGGQSMGGGGGGGMGMGMGMMNVPPEKVGQVDVPVVCLEHGKHDPRPNMPYEIKPLESFTTTPGVRELCQMLGAGQVEQRVAQAAAWHLNNGMSWEELSAKRLRHANGTSEPYFSPAEIQAGMQIASTAVKTAEERSKQNSGTSSSVGNSTSP
jgi:hypothetical protein